MNDIAISLFGCLITLAQCFNRSPLHPSPSTKPPKQFKLYSLYFQVRAQLWMKLESKIIQNKASHHIFFYKNLFLAILQKPGISIWSTVWMIKVKEINLILSYNLFLSRIRKNVTFRFSSMVFIFYITDCWEKWNSSKNPFNIMHSDISAICWELFVKKARIK